MPGIFSPTLQESQTAIQPVSPVTDNSFGNALRGIDNILRTVSSDLSDNGDDEGTQKERDNAALIPFVQRLNEIQKQSESGNLSAFKKRAMVNELVNQTLEAVPVLREDLTKLSNTVTGIDVDIPDMSPQEVLIRNQEEWSKSPEGLFYATQSVSFNDKGEFDSLATRYKYDQFYYQSLADNMELVRLKNQVEKSEAGTKLRQSAEDDIGSTYLEKHLKLASDTVATNLMQFAANFDSSTPIDDQVLLDSINQQIMVLKTKFTQESVSLFPNSKTYNLDTALSPLTNLKTFIETRRDSLPKLAEALKARDQTVIREFTRKLIGVGPASEDVFTYLMNNMLLGKVDEARTKMNIKDEFLAIEDDVFGTGAQVETDSEGNETVPSNPDSVFDSEQLGKHTDISEEDAETNIKGFTTFFNTTPIEAFSTDSMRQEAVRRFGQGIASYYALENRGPLSNNSLKKIYSPEFMRRYEKVVKSNDIASTNLRKSVQLHLATVFEQKLAILEKDMKNNEVPTSVKLIFKDGNLVISGIPELSNMQMIGRVTGGSLRNPEENHLGLPRSIREKTNELNEVYKLMKSFPDENTKKAFEKFVSERLTPANTNGLNFVEVRNRQDYDTAPSGAIVVWMNSDGTMGDVGVKP